MLVRSRSVVVLTAVLALVSGALLLLYAHWSKPVSAAWEAIEARDPERALDEYAVSARRFAQLPPAQELLAADFSEVTHNRLALLYRLGRYDDMFEVADNAPANAAPHFWIGCALFAKSKAEKKPDARLEWLSRAEDEFKLALAAAPDDWDTKYNYELAARLAAALRAKPKAAPETLMQLLRQQPRTGREQEPVKKVG